MNMKLTAAALAALMTFSSVNESRANDAARLLFGIIGAVVVGAVIANVVAQLDADAKAKRDAAIAAASKRSVPTSKTWKTNDASGTVTVAKVEKMPDGKVCREIQETITFQGKPSTESRTECV
jgi:surface antigen